jgi:hypothetical protein
MSNPNEAKRNLDSAADEREPNCPDWSASMQCASGNPTYPACLPLVASEMITNVSRSPASEKGGRWRRHDRFDTLRRSFHCGRNREPYQLLDANRGP